MRLATSDERPETFGKGTVNTRSLVRSLWSLVALTAFSSLAFAAEEVTVASRVFPEKATLGDDIHLWIQVERPKKFSALGPSRKAKVAPFEIKSIETSPIVRGNNRIRETFMLTLAVFELGDLTIPPIPIEVQSDTGRHEIALTDPVHVKIVSVGRKKTDKDDIRPIKGPVSYDLSGFWTWAGGILVALLALFLTIKIILRRRKKIVDPESLKPPHERALLELGRLKQKDYLGEKKTKEFYSELSDILRHYLERRFGIMALGRTTREVLSDLKIRDLSTGLIGEVKEVLEHSDLVKFAKYEAPRAWAQELEKKLAGILDETKPAEEQNEKTHFKTSS